MRITNLKSDKSLFYTSNAFLVLGNWSAINDINTLIDTGSDPGIVERIAEAPTGLGKNAIEQVILTHSHSDHIAILPLIREKYHPVVYAYSAFTGADFVLKDGQILHCGDRYFEVIHVPCHSDDSICLYCSADGVLFVGDTSFLRRTTDEIYEDSFVAVLERLCRLNIRTIYSGHDTPIVCGTQALLLESLRNVLIARDRQHSP